MLTIIVNDEKLMIKTFHIPNSQLLQLCRHHHWKNDL